jgi:hypothetical protein
MSLCPQTRPLLLHAAKGQGGDVPETPAYTDATTAHESLLATLSKLSIIQQPSSGAAAARKGAKGGTVKGSRGAKRGRSGAANDAAPGGDAGSGSGYGSPQRRVFVVVLDEVDRLMRRRDGGEELARLFQLPITPGKMKGDVDAGDARRGMRAHLCLSHVVTGTICTGTRSWADFFTCACVDSFMTVKALACHGGNAALENFMERRVRTLVR